MRFAIVVTGPAYGTQQASSAFQFAQALIAEGHELSSVFFYREGVYNANQLTSPQATNLTCAQLATVEYATWCGAEYLRSGGITPWRC